MSLYGAFDKTKHFEELDEPMEAGGHSPRLTPTERRDTAVQNLTDNANAVAANLGAQAALADLGQYSLTVEFDDLGTASSAWVVAPFAGTIVDAFSVPHATLATVATVVTAELAGDAVTDFQITIAAGAVAGEVDQSTAITGANTVAAGTAIEAITDGGGTGPARGTITLIIERS